MPIRLYHASQALLASECGASLILVNEWDRATGQLVVGQARALAPALPLDATCLATGGITTIEQVRELRNAGYDGVVLGRAYPGSRGRELVDAILQEEPRSRIVERIAWDGRVVDNGEDHERVFILQP
jgi:phosphoribosylformimino-5-aminoimidazole carboxamide ribonucleotide (ProFAR) isomerase